jgi:predicted  nucleic acid-binding Zn-ribbon protein
MSVIEKEARAQEAWENSPMQQLFKKSREVGALKAEIGILKMSIERLKKEIEELKS